MSDTYKIIKRQTIEHLQEDVGKEIDLNGYTPLGGVQIETYPAYGPTFYQTLIKYPYPPQLIENDIKLDPPTTLPITKEPVLLNTNTEGVSATPIVQYLKKQRKKVNNENT